MPHLALPIRRPLALLPVGAFVPWCWLFGCIACVVIYLHCDLVIYWTLDIDDCLRGSRREGPTCQCALGYLAPCPWTSCTLPLLCLADCNCTPWVCLIAPCLVGSCLVNLDCCFLVPVPSAHYPWWVGPWLIIPLQCHAVLLAFRYLDCVPAHYPSVPVFGAHYPIAHPYPLPLVAFVVYICLLYIWHCLALLIAHTDLDIALPWLVITCALIVQLPWLPLSDLTCVGLPCVDCPLQPVALCCPWTLLVAYLVGSYLWLLVTLPSPLPTYLVFLVG